MKDLGLKFTIYDFLGYFIPGLIAIVMIWINKNLLEGDPISVHNLKLMLNELNLTFVGFIIILIYVIGFGISSIGSLVIERTLFKYIGFLKKKIDIESLLSSNTLQCVKNCFKTIYGKDYENSDRQGLVAYVAQKRIQVYGRAFFFLVLYGFCRSLCMLFCINLIFVFIKWSNIGHTWYILISSIIVIFLFAFSYVRFKRLYELEIVYGFIMNC